MTVEHQLVPRIIVRKRQHIFWGRCTCNDWATKTGSLHQLFKNFDEHNAEHTTEAVA